MFCSIALSSPLTKYTYIHLIFMNESPENAPVHETHQLISMNISSYSYLKQTTSRAAVAGAATSSCPPLLCVVFCFIKGLPSCDAEGRGIKLISSGGPTMAAPAANGRSRGIAAATLLIFYVDSPGR